MISGFPRRVLILSACGWLLLFPALQAQEAGPAPAFKPEAPSRPERKTPGWFHRPAEKTASAQLQYADELLAAGHEKEATRQYYALVCTWHESPQAPAAQLAYAKLLEMRGNYLDAFNEFQYLIDNFAGRFPFNEALDHQFRIANTVMTERRGKFLIFPGHTTPEQALPLFEQIVKNGPQWKNTPQAQFYVGVIHEGNHDYDKAIAAYEAVSVAYRDNPQTPEAVFRRAECLYILANANPRHEPGYRDALSALAMFLRDYPNNPNVDTARKHLDGLKERLAALYYERAEFYDKIAHRPQAAVIAYADFIRNFPTSELVTQASERMDALKRQTEKHHDSP